MQRRCEIFLFKLLALEHFLSGNWSTELLKISQLLTGDGEDIRYLISPKTMTLGSRTKTRLLPRVYKGPCQTVMGPLSPFRVWALNNGMLSFENQFVKWHPGCDLKEIYDSNNQSRLEHMFTLTLWEPITPRLREGFCKPVCAQGSSTLSAKV